MAIISLIVLLLAAGCGGGGDGAGNGEENGGGEAAVENPVDPATAASIAGRVLFTGTAPEPEPILMDAEPVCQEKHPDGAFTETVVVNGDGTLQNVFVYVKDGLGDLEFPVPEEGVVLDQTGCHYVPHVLGVQVGQDLIIRNSDGILHNIHPMPTTNRAFNLGQPVAMDSTKQFTEVEVMIPIECDVHDWMLGYLGVLDHPYFDTTGEDGAFSLPNLPPGTYTIAAWHELYGEQTMSVTVGEQEAAEIEFTFEGS
ncbi:MAG: carboxypeptidase regulatory-like domain-containing protein [Chloroflexi bacterium]|nr:carboxypeptidase regulatory-like domain-containing protein [Chloroflexota bacterium]MCI0580695.1 carboxypeptidase regulatory-like domain-containing protein [Chloroflexota bacterium]MCI0648574.1 carboxypeptidase regulatory-like domain-containing protein [Chloroflexota bacterium]MCI0727337.1 carboxypeptidase regulatory-like domain-containing protein [Chloroflexota bacterium]